MAKFTATVSEKEEYGGLAIISFEADCGLRAEPGQFLHVLCGGEGGIILRRPFSFFDAEEMRFSLLVKRTGPGSGWLADRVVGQEIDCMGPLGKPFSFCEDDRPALIAGGVGIAPLAFLFKKMSLLNMKPVLFWGIENTADYVGLPALVAGEMQASIACEDGGLGFPGTVIELFEAERSGAIDSVYCCGPKGMLIAISDMLIREPGVKTYFSLEERMACGIGACKGCAVPASTPAGGYLTVCKDGPVFEGKELDWSRV